MPSPRFSMNFAIGESLLIGSSSSRFESPTERNAVRTFCVSTFSVCSIVSPSDYIKRHKDCPGGSHTLSQTESVSPGGRMGRGWCITRSAASS